MGTNVRHRSVVTSTGQPSSGELQKEEAEAAATGLPKDKAASISSTLGPAAVPVGPTRPEEDDATWELKTKPTYRGVLHHYGAIASLFSGVALVASCLSESALSEGRLQWSKLIGSSVYSASMTLLLGTSAAYHRLHWPPAARVWMRRLDHSSIFLLIAGTYTPLCLLALQPREAAHLLLTVWSGALAGIFKCLFWPYAPKPLSTALYILLGWVALPYVREFSKWLGPVGGTLMLLGGLCYTVGGVIYAAKWPDPAPSVFGYHEIFHALVLVACMCHFSVVARLVHNVNG